MRISASQVNQALRTYLLRQQAPDKAASRRPSGDHVSLSATVRQVDGWIQAAKALPDVRPERVAAVKQALASGRYAPNQAAVAEQMLRQLLTDKALEE